MSKTTNKISPEACDRVVRIIGDQWADNRSKWEAMVSIAGKIGCTAEKLRRWCRDAAGRQAGPAVLGADERTRLKMLERGLRELRGANEILRKASAYCDGGTQPHPARP